MIHLLNEISSDYGLQLALTEKRVGEDKRPLTVEKIKSELRLRFQRLNMSSCEDNGGNIFEKYALFSAQFKGKCRQCG
jgi:hypothetical protein